jgi:hypothetical protein
LADETDRRTQLFQALTSLGIKPNVALGAMASLAGESGVNFDPSSLGDASIPGGSVGIGQWNKERRAALLDYARSQGASPNDFQTQLGYLKQELSNPNLATYQSGVLGALRNANTTAQGTQIWTGQFERPLVDNSAQRMQLTSQVGSVDANGNFTPGGGRAPARPVTPTPATATPGTSIASVPAAAGASSGVLPGFGTKEASDKFLAGLKQAGILPEDDKSGQQQQPKPAEIMGGPGLRNSPGLAGIEAAARQIGPQLTGYSPGLYGQSLNSQPMSWGSSPLAPPPWLKAGAQQAQGYGTNLNSLQQMFMDNGYG